MSALFSQKDYVMSTHNDRRSRNRKLVVSPDDEIERKVMGEGRGFLENIGSRIGDRGSGIGDRGSSDKKQ